MKAICGFLRLDGAPADALALETMHCALRGGGIAQHQSWVSGAVALAGTAWWPVDDAVSDPVLYVHAASGCVVVADALLFEREVLRAQLGVEAAHAASDAELIALAWLRWGEACAARLYGDFAFAIWDPRSGVMYAVRDGVGVRPLCIHHAPGRLFAFASDASAVAALPGVGRRLDERRIAEYLIDDECSEIESTFFANVRRLPPAHHLRVGAVGLRRERYWTPDGSEVSCPPRGDAAWEDAIRQALVAAVDRHLERGRNIGSMLSGGLDSSSVAAIALARLGSRGDARFPVFSAINGADKGCVETRTIHSMLADPGFEAHLADVADLTAMDAQLERAVAASEDPFDGSMALVHAMYQLAASSGTGAVFDGIDADAAFSEGAYLQRLLRAGHWRTTWREAQGEAAFYGPQFPAWKTVLAQVPALATPEFVKGRLRGWRRRLVRRKDIVASLLEPGFARRVLPPVYAPQHAMGDIAPGRSAALHERLTTRLFHGTVAGIERYRRVASWHGIEPRHPFLDRHLLDLCLHLPGRQCLRGGWPKAVLRRAMAPYLPVDVCWRRGKEHLGFLFNERVLRIDPQRVDRIWEERDLLAGWIDQRKLRGHIDRYRRQGGAEEADILSPLWVLQAWLTGPTAMCLKNS